MPERAIIDKPGFEHGADGYRKGCGCLRCREGHRKRIAGNRSRARERNQEPEEVEAFTFGPIERSVRSELENVKDANPDGPWNETLGNLALKLAKAIDAIPPSEQFRLSPLVGRLADVMDRMARTSQPQEKVELDLSELLKPE